MWDAPLVWNGARRLGPIGLGMSLDEVAAAIPGEGLFFDVGGENPDPDPPYYWDSDELGLSVQFLDGVVISISASREFIIDGENLVGLAAEAAISRAGGETGRKFYEPVQFVETAAGLELYVEDDRILAVVLADNTEEDE